jgi:hypothetical protein
MTLIYAALISVNVYFGIESGNALNWAAAVFVGVMLMVQLMSERKKA